MAAFSSPADWRDLWIYLLLVDRFDNPAAPPKAPWDEPYGGFQGGTFDGVIARLDFLADLGAGALWLAPVLADVGFQDGDRGRGIADFTRVEPRLCADPERARVDPAYADAQLRAVVDAAHERGLYVVLDIVLNHTGDVFAYDGPGGRAPSRELVTDRRDDTGRFPVRDALTTAYADVIRRFDVDGFRVDTLVYAGSDFARWFGNAMREHAAELGKANFFTFGEVHADEERISAYVGRHAGRGGDLVGVDAALDLPLFSVLPPVVKGELAPTVLAAMYRRRRARQDGVIASHGDATRYFVTFLDNHDQHERFAYADPADPDRYAAQTSLGLTALMTSPGIPCVYYGTEAGLHGAGDGPEAVRQALWGAPGAFDPAAPAAATLRTLTRLRADHPALRYGRQYFRPVSGDGRSYGLSPYPGGIMAWSRILAGKEIVVVANTSVTAGWSGHVIVDATLSGPAPVLLYGNADGPVPPAAPVDRPSGSVNTDDGVSKTLGPVRTVAVELRPMEIQVFTTTPS